MSLALAAFGLKAAGSIFGGLSARKAAKRKAAFQKKQVLMQRGYALEDLGLSSTALQSKIMAGAGARGIRTTSGSVRAVQSDEMLKSGRRRERILAGSEMELKAIAMNLKSEKQAATVGAIMGVADSATSYYGGEK